MDDFDELSLDLQPEVSTSTATETKTETKFEELPKLEDLLKSETDVAPIQAPTMKGLKQVGEGSKTVEKNFARKEDAKRNFVKRRLKILTGVYACVCSLLLGFVFFNTASLVNLGKTTNVETQQIQQGTVYMQGQDSVANSEVANMAGELTVNTPRDYGDDDTELTFFDRLTIMFKSLFG